MVTWFRPGRMALAVGAMASSLFVWVASANALDYVSSSTNVLPGYNALGTKCLRGEKVLSGGVTTTLHYGEGSVVSTIPVDGTDSNRAADDAWRAEVFAAADAPPAHMTTFSVCGKPALVGTLRYVSATKTAHGGIASSVATCPKGRVLGGGVDAGALALAFGSQPVDGPDNDRKPDDGWQGSISMFGTAPYSFTTYAICAVGRYADKLKYVERDGTADPLRRTSLRANCPIGGDVIGGGVAAELRAGKGNLDGTSGADGPDQGPVPDDAWRGRVDNTSSTPAAMRAFAICSG